jgi:hypothetical protein
MLKGSVAEPDPDFFPPPLLLLFLDPGSEIRIRDLETGIRKPAFGNRDPEWVKIRIRDKHPGSVTLFKGTPVLKVQKTTGTVFI